MKSVSLRLRLTVTSLVVVTTAMAGMGWTLLVAVRHQVWKQNDRALAERARALAALVEFDEGIYRFEDYRTTALGLGRHSGPVYFQVWRPDRTVLARSEALGKSDLPFLEPPLSDPLFFELSLLDGEQGRLVSLAFVPRRDPEDGPPELGQGPPLTVAVAESTREVRRTLSILRQWFLLLASGSILSAVLATAWAIRRGLRPLARLAAAIDGLSAERLSLRLSLEEQPSELRAPVRELNLLLARLENSFEREKRFTADASHELRTPLAGLRSILEVAATKKRSGASYREAIQEALVCLGHIGAVVEALLVLARHDADNRSGEDVAVGLRALVDEVWRESAATAAARGLQFRNRIEPEAIVIADRAMLRLIIRNLLSNAVEYTGEGGWIEVGGGQVGLVFDVTNSGPPLPPEQLEQIFDRFWRADQARTSAGVHVGLGLSLVRKACDSLGWIVSAVNLEEGAVRFRVSVATPHNS